MASGEGAEATSCFGRRHHHQRLQLEEVFSP
jgi:hypothetical protein